MKRFLYINILLFLFSLINIFSQDNTTDNYYNGIVIKIEHANPKVYYQNDELYINIKILNTSKDEKSLLVANDKKFSFDFQMVTMQNKNLEHSKEYITSFHKVQPVFNSNIRLAPDEGYVFEARLNDYFNLDTPGQYYIKCLYYPELKLNDSTKNVIASNLLSINIRPSNISQSNILEQSAVEEEKKLYLTKRPPDEVVSFTLNARMNQDWDEFFLYLDLDKLIQNNNLFRDKYLKADSERQKVLINQYKDYLKKNTIDEISFLPNKFEIVKTEYSDGKGKVDAIITFKYLEYEERKYYTYYLNKKNDVWLITSYEVMNLERK